MAIRWSRNRFAVFLALVSLIVTAKKAEWQDLIESQGRAISDFLRGRS